MADNTITGRAKKYDGTPIDYVSIFNWSDGKCIAQVTPDASGNWQYIYDRDLKVGFAYVADGCEPVAHGAYDFLYEAPASVIPTDYILAYDFNGDLFDRSVNALHGVKSGSTVFSTGRKVGTQALEFIKGSVVTSQVLPINSNKLTVSFWISTSQLSFAAIYDLKEANAYLNSSVSRTVESVYTQSGLANQVTSPIAFSNIYQHIIVEIDKTQPALDEHKIYVNNIKSSSQGKLRSDGTTNFANNLLMIGNAHGNSWYFSGRIQDLRVYNRVLSEVERTQLFNE